MRISIIASDKDPAGQNISGHLLRKGIGERPVTIGEHCVVMNSIPGELVFSDIHVDADGIIFASKHQSESKMKTLSVHPIGNFGPAGLGGIEKELGHSMPSMMKKAMIELSRNAPPGYSVTMEATHHGPFLKTPCMFIEIGSDIDSWQDQDAGKAVSDAIIAALSSPEQYQAAVGFGGSHYCSSFNKLMLESPVCMGHICTKHNLEFLDGSLIRQMLERSIEPCQHILLDWKGLGPEKQKLIALLNEMGLDYSKTKDAK